MSSSNNQPSSNQEAHEEAMDVMTGFCSTHPGEIPALNDWANWQSKAQALIDARQFQILEALSPETLKEIAAGRLNMAEVYQKARATAEAERKSS